MERDADKTVVLKNALAEYFECNPDEIGSFVIGCERQVTEDTTAFASIWSALPHWYISGFVDELRDRVDKQRNQSELESMMNNG